MDILKKKLFLVFGLVFISLIPRVYAMIDEFYNVLSTVFGGTTETIVLLRAGIFIIIFAVIFNGACLALRSKGSATILSLVVALISARFMPEYYVSYLADAWGVFGMVVIVLAIVLGFLAIIRKILPLGQSKWFGLVWAILFFFLAWVFSEVRHMSTDISYELNEMLPLIGLWGMGICIFLGIVYLMIALFGQDSGSFSRYARPYTPRERGERGPGWLSRLMDRRRQNAQERAAQRAEEDRRRREQEATPTSDTSPANAQGKTWTSRRRLLLKLFIKPNQINYGETANLIWGTRDAKQVQIFEGSGRIIMSRKVSRGFVSGSLKVSPKVRTNYTLRATGYDNSTRQIVKRLVVTQLALPHGNPKTKKLLEDKKYYEGRIRKEKEQLSGIKRNLDENNRKKLHESQINAGLKRIRKKEKDIKDYEAKLDEIERMLRSNYR